jgi:hypothetical protein
MPSVAVIGGPQTQEKKQAAHFTGRHAVQHARTHMITQASKLHDDPMAPQAVCA